MDRGDIKIGSDIVDEIDALKSFLKTVEPLGGVCRASGISLGIKKTYKFSLFGFRSYTVDIREDSIDIPKYMYEYIKRYASDRLKELEKELGDL